MPRMTAAFFTEKPVLEPPEFRALGWTARCKPPLSNSLYGLSCGFAFRIPMSLSTVGYLRGCLRTYPRNIPLFQEIQMVSGFCMLRLTI